MKVLIDCHSNPSKSQSLIKITVFGIGFQKENKCSLNLGNRIRKNLKKRKLKLRSKWNMLNLYLQILALYSKIEFFEIIYGCSTSLLAVFLKNY